MTSTMIRAIHKVAFHRNGVFGDGFHVVTFTPFADVATPGPRFSGNHLFVGVVFAERGCVAVLDATLAAEDTIEFGENSWRGDQSKMSCVKPWRITRQRAAPAPRNSNRRAAAWSKLKKLPDQPSHHPTKRPTAGARHPAVCQLLGRGVVQDGRSWLSGCSRCLRRHRRRGPGGPGVPGGHSARKCSSVQRVVKGRTQQR